MLLHVSEDHTQAVAVSFPRDLVIPIPSCTNPATGKTASAMAAQPINVALGHGGMGCVAQTITDLTGADVDFAGMITFTGVIEMSNAVGGVPVCLSDPINDKYSGFNRPAGVQLLSGQDALAFLRSRHGVGDGSDLTRISSQQVFLSSLVRTLKSNDTLGDFGKLYAIASAATRNMQLSTSLASPDTMVSIAQALKGIDLPNVTFVQYPGLTHVPGPNFQKVLPNKALANTLFAKINADEPFLLAQAGDGHGSRPDPNATPLPAATPTAEPSSTATAPPSEAPPAAAPPSAAVTIPGISGQTAADQTCTVGYGK
jgi:LCP family protein required for cell wall assembly